MQCKYLFFFIIFLAFYSHAQNNQHTITKIVGKDTVIIVKPFTKDTFVKNGQVFTYVEQMPEFYGDYNKYLSKNLHYPADAQKAGIKGRVAVRFVILANGKTDSVSVLRSVCPSIDSEAVRVIKNMPAWKPGRNGGKPVNVWYNLPIIFSLKDPEKQ